MIFRCLAALSVLFVSIHSFADGPSWDELARQALSDEPATSQAALLLLQRDPNLRAELLHGIKNDHSVEAIQLIHILHVKTLYPEVIEAAKADLDPLSWRTAIAVSNATEKKMLSEILLAKSQADWKKLQDSQKRSWLDSADELGTLVPAKFLNSLLNDSSYEVRMGSARLAGVLFEKTRDRSYATTLQEAVTKHPYQLRLEALEEVRSLSDPLRRQIKLDPSMCLRDENIEVRRLCAVVSQGKS